MREVSRAAVIGVMLACGCGESPEQEVHPAPALEAWSAAAVERGLVVHKDMADGPVCRPGAEIPAFQKVDGPVPDRHCTVVLGRPGYSRLFQMSVMTFPDAHGLDAVVERLRQRCADGCDPTEPGVSKGIVTGWVQGREVWWLTTMAGREEGMHRELLGLAGRSN